MVEEHRSVPSSEQLYLNICNQHRNLGDQHRNLGDQHCNLGDQNRNLGDQHCNLGDQHRNLGDQHRNLGDQHCNVDDQHCNVFNSGDRLLCIYALSHIISGNAISSLTHSKQDAFNPTPVANSRQNPATPLHLTTGQDFPILPHP